MMLFSILISSFIASRRGEKRKGAQSPKTPQSQRRRVLNGSEDEGQQVQPRSPAPRTPSRKGVPVGESSLFSSPARSRQQQLAGNKIFKFSKLCPY